LQGELDTKQRSLELTRAEYIKERADIAQQMWSIKRPLDYKVDLKPPEIKEPFNRPDTAVQSAPIEPIDISKMRYKRPTTTKTRKTKSAVDDFQTFMLKEKEFQLQVMNNLNISDHNSMKLSSVYPASHRSDKFSPIGAFQNDGRMSKATDSFNSESSGSLQYMSKNLNAGTKL
jgi:hypothetical protein